MGTHGRNAITKDGVHTCYEQTLGGGDAIEELLDDTLKTGEIPTVIRPTMEDRTDECDHGSTYAHIDYDHKKIYVGYPDPQECIKIEPHPLRRALAGDHMNPQVISEQYGWDEEDNPEGYHRFCAYLLTEIEGCKKLEEKGWEVIWEAEDCPDEVDCVNSSKNKYDYENGINDMPDEEMSRHA